MAFRISNPPEKSVEVFKLWAEALSKVEFPRRAALFESIPEENIRDGMYALLESSFDGWLFRVPSLAFFPGSADTAAKAIEEILKVRADKRDWDQRQWDRVKTTIWSTSNFILEEWVGDTHHRVLEIAVTCGNKETGVISGRVSWKDVMLGVTPTSIEMLVESANDVAGAVRNRAWTLTLKKVLVHTLAREAAEERGTEFSGSISWASARLKNVTHAAPMNTYIFEDSLLFDLSSGEAEELQIVNVEGCCKELPLDVGSGAGAMTSTGPSLAQKCAVKVWPKTKKTETVHGKEAEAMCDCIASVSLAAADADFSLTDEEVATAGGSYGFSRGFLGRKRGSGSGSGSGSGNGRGSGSGSHGSDALSWR